MLENAFLFKSNKITCNLSVAVKEGRAVKTGKTRNIRAAVQTKFSIWQKHLFGRLQVKTHLLCLLFRLTGINYFAHVGTPTHALTCAFSMYKCRHTVSINSHAYMRAACAADHGCVRGCCWQVENCLPPEGLRVPAACGNHGALPGYKPLVCTDKKTWRAKINYLQADPCTPRLAWHFCI